jgi:hypothetical protein
MNKRITTAKAKKANKEGEEREQGREISYTPFSFIFFFALFAFAVKNSSFLSSRFFQEVSV